MWRELWTALGTRQGCMGRFVGPNDSINIPTVHSTVKLNSCHYNGHIHTPFISTLTPRFQSIPLIPISLWQGPPTETLVSCYNSWQLCKRSRQISQVIFFQYQLCVLIEVLHKHTFMLVPLLHCQGARAILTFLNRSLMFDWVQCHSGRNAAFGWDPVWISDHLYVFFVSAEVQKQFSHKWISAVWNIKAIFFRKTESIG